MNIWHEVAESDKPRIPCSFAGCTKQADACEHVHWNTGNTTGVSFWYYCAAHSETVKRTGKAYDEGFFTPPDWIN
jgi:hypothetical protein